MLTTPDDWFSIFFFFFFYCQAIFMQSTAIFMNHYILVYLFIYTFNFL